MASLIAYGNPDLPIYASMFGIRSKWQGELRIPFACHVRQPSSTVLNVSFDQFARLPAELQLNIIQFCDKPILFQLMQTSHFIRTEATKLFFADPEAWYCVEAIWLEIGGYLSDGPYDIDFLRCIQRLHVDCYSLKRETWTDEYILKFWNRVQCLYPQAKYIMLSEDITFRPRHLDSLGIASWPPPELHRRVCQLCPPDINVFISLLRNNDRSKITLWRRVTIQEGDNLTQELHECQNHPRPSIIVPHKRFHGQVGKCQYVFHQGPAIMQQKNTLQSLRFAIIERHHYHKRHEAFECPAPNCDAWFERPGDFTRHVRRGSGEHHDDCYVFQEPYQSIFAEGKKRLEQLEQRYDEICEPFFKWWGKFGSEERKVAEKELLHQLEYDNSLHVQGEPFSKPTWLVIMESYGQEN